MEVILLDKVENLGDVGDLVSVKPGFGRNYLLPTGRATLATRHNIAEFEARRAELEQAAVVERKEAEARAKLIRNMELIVPANVGPEGKLFGSVGPVDVAMAFEKVGVEIARSEVRMPDGPLHEPGEFTIGVHLHSDVNVDITLRIVPAE